MTNYSELIVLILLVPFFMQIVVPLVMTSCYLLWRIFQLIFFPKTLVRKKTVETISPDKILNGAR